MAEAYTVEEFDKVFPELLDKIFAIEEKKFGKSVAERFRHVMQYNVPHGKKNRGMMVVQTYLVLSGGKTDDLKNAAILGWCVEFLQAFFLVADDVMDGGEMRRGQQCWFRKDDVGLVAVNDSFYLESIVYELLKIYFRNESYYVDLYEIFHSISMNTVIGQALDLLTCPPAVPGIEQKKNASKSKFESFSTDNYMQIAKNKTAYYSFVLPIKLGMIVSNGKLDQFTPLVCDILLKMGEFFQIQDDFMDVYADAQLLGKIGKDIPDGKLTWLIAKALEHSEITCEQLAILEDNYAEESKDSIDKVVKVYNQLGMQQIFQTYSEQVNREICESVRTLGDSQIEQLIELCWKKIYKRKK